jgi:hypothetical protein
MSPRDLASTAGRKRFSLCQCFGFFLSQQAVREADVGARRAEKMRLLSPLPFVGEPNVRFGPTRRRMRTPSE